MDKDTICLYDTAQIQLAVSCAKVPVRIKWTPATGLSSDTVSNPLAFPLVTQEYVARITDNQNNVVHDTVLVEVDATCCKSMALFELDKSVYCLGDLVHAINLSRVGGSPTYTWNFSARVASQSGALMKAVVFNTPGAKTVQLIVQDDCGIDTFERELYIHELPNVEAGSDTTLCLPDTVSFGIENLADLSYSWFPTAGIFDSLSGITQAKPTAARMYYLTVIDPFTGCANTDSVQVSNKQVEKIHLGADTTLCELESVVLGISKNGKYQWNTGESTQFIVVKEAGSYILTFSQRSCISSDTLQVMMDSVPSFTLGADIESCGDTLIQLAPNRFKREYTYLWDNNSSDSTRTVSTTGSYWLEIENVETRIP